MGCASYTKMKLTGSLVNALEKRFIAFDTETTGLDSYYCRIIEVGAVLFEGGRPVKSYGSLVHSVEWVPYEAQMVNHISTAMVKAAPSPGKVYAELIDFFGGAMQGDTILVGHNMTFDMKFLSREFDRMGISADLLYTDTCALSRIVAPNLYDHTQDTVARHFHIQNRQGHRAESDASTCGQILAAMLPLLKEQEKLVLEGQKRQAKKEKNEPGEEEKAVCASLAATLEEESLKERLSFQRTGKLVHVRFSRPFFGFSLCGRHPYLLASREVMTAFLSGLPQGESMEIVPGTAAEEKLYPDAVRLFLDKEEVGAMAMKLLQRGCEEEKIPEAIERWNRRREKELFWSPWEL